ATYVHYVSIHSFQRPASSCRLRVANWKSQTGAGSSARFVSALRIGGAIEIALLAAQRFVQTFRGLPARAAALPQIPILFLQLLFLLLQCLNFPPALFELVVGILRRHGGRSPRLTSVQQERRRCRPAGCAILMRCLMPVALEPILES